MIKERFYTLHYFIHKKNSGLKINLILAHTKTNTMSLFDLIPEDFQQYIPFLKKKQDRKKLQDQLNVLQLELKKEGEQPKTEIPEGSEENTNPENTALADSINKIKDVLAESETPWYRKVLKLGLYITPVVLSYFLAIYIQSSNGLQLEQQEIIQPMSYYSLVENDSSTFVLTEDYKERFWTDFPIYYFTPDFDLEGVVDTSLFFFDEKGANIEAKMILNNTSSSFPIMVSTLQIEVTKILAPAFPWENINTTPVLERVTTNSYTGIKNTGAAPALNLLLTHHISDKESVEMEYYSLYAKETLIYDPAPYLDGFVQTSVNASTKKLDSAFYVFKDPQTAKNEDYKYETINDVEFRVIETATNLRDITEVIEVAEIDMVLSYTTVVDEKLEMKWKEKLDYPVIYYVNVNELLTFEEAESYNYPKWENPIENSFLPNIEGNIMLPLAEKAFTALGNEPKFYPEGVSLISEKITVNLNGMGSGMVRSNFINPDQLLNAKGYVIIYLNLENASNGTYKVSIKANAEFVSEFYLETLVPDETKFNYPESLKYFEKKEGEVEN